MTQLDEARAFFANDRYATHITGCTIEAVGPQYAKCTLELEPHHLNAAGQIMGGTIYTLADFTFAVASNFRQSVTVTLTAQVSYLAPVKGHTLTAESRLLKNGRRNCFYHVTVTDELDTTVAVVHFTGAHL